MLTQIYITHVDAYIINTTIHNVQEPELTPVVVRPRLPLMQAVTQVRLTIILLQTRKFKFHFPMCLFFLVNTKKFLHHTTIQIILDNIFFRQ